MSNGRSRWIAILLVCSLAVNLLLLGALLGRFFRERAYPGTFPPHIGWILRGLPEEERQNIRPVLREHQRRAELVLRALISAQEEASKQLRSEELVEHDLQDALAALRAASNASQQAMHDALAEVMQRLEPGQREQVMRSMRGDWSGEMRRRGDRRRGRRPPLVQEEKPPPPP